MDIFISNMPWIISALNFIILSYFLFFERKNSRKQRTGKKAKDTVEEILVPARRKVTLLQIQMVGISKLADYKIPEHGIQNIRKLIKTIENHVSTFDGLCIRRPPSALLCVFGLSYDNEPQQTNQHVQNALNCASEMQRENAKENILANQTGDQVVPLSLGLHTAEVLIGSLNKSEPLELLVAGKGVDMVERLSTACDKHRVMVSPKTLELMKVNGWAGSDLKPRQIQGILKHDTLEAYELDPFKSTSQILSEAEAAHRKFTGAVRGDERWAIDKKFKIEIKVQGATGSLIDFSISGFAIDLDRYFSVGSFLNLKFKESSLHLEEKLQKDLGISTILCEVMWAKTLENGKFLHGIKSVELDPSIAGKLIDALKEYVTIEKTKISA